VVGSPELATQTDGVGSRWTRATTFDSVRALLPLAPPRGGSAAMKSTDNVGLLLALLWCLAFWLVVAVGVTELT
jgi:hypothetical protein